ncbi:uncharacterized protein LOC107262273 [Ricinus communis]|uniref:uncharacterized protein LOC107262273 n=1 Tax=Ricinus communis TaxID=3988 RepID=UPI00201B322D|nr:uncharacterized protein LOC107262273 [Ricinus communis]
MQMVSRQLVSFSLLVILWLMICPMVLACGSGNGNACKDCITNQMKHGCPACAPILQCMARCLWAGASKAKCIKKCDCEGAMLTLSDCKRCMSHCKCSCASYT